MIIIEENNKMKKSKRNIIEFCEFSITFLVLSIEFGLKLEVLAEPRGNVMRRSYKRL